MKCCPYVDKKCGTHAQCVKCKGGTRMLESKENAIEFLYGDKEATVTFCSPKYVSRIKKLAEERPEECRIAAENEDGSVVAHVPVKWVKINPTKVLSDEQRQALSERAKRVWSKEV